MEAELAGALSHAVHHGAGPVAHIPNLAGQTGTHGDTGAGSAVRHGAHELPPGRQRTRAFA